MISKPFQHHAGGGIITGDSIYYSYEAIDGRQAVFRAVIGARGIGKTYGAKLKFLHLPEGRQGMWVRRYTNELDKCMDGFCRDLVQRHAVDPDTVRLDGDTLQVSPDGNAWRDKIYFQSLSLGDKIKSSSYPATDMMCYDEFIIQRGRVTYLPDEDRKLLDLYSTVFRDRPGICYLLANNISFINPIFLSEAFNVSDFEGRFRDFGPLDDHGDVIRDPVTNRPFISVEKWANQRYSDHMKNTVFGRFISTVEYGQYAIENKSLMDTPELIGPHPEGARRLYNIRMGTVTLGAYRYEDSGEYVYYFDESCDRTQRTYAPRQGLKPGEYPLMNNQFPMKVLKTWPGKMTFSCPRAKGMVNDMLTSQYFK